MEAFRKRCASEAGIYHVFSRGVGRQIIFEGDEDRLTFLKILKKVASKRQVTVLAWCLMDNHFHFLLQGPLDEISHFMKELLSPYALYFNSRNGREGCVFQGRYGSEPIHDESYLFQAVRYIHQNPEKAMVAPTSRYRWSSYQEYLHRACIAETTPVLEMFGTIQAFVAFHQRESSFGLREYDDSRGAASAKRALQVAIDELGENELHLLRALPRSERDRSILRLSSRGLTQRQIERLTGVSRSTVSRILEANATE